MYKEVKIQKNGVEANNLIALLSDVRQYIDKFNEKYKKFPNFKPQEWESYMDDIDNETIGINGSEYLIFIKPIDDSIYNKLCASLADITMTLEYQDIYNNNYHYEPNDFKNFAKKDDFQN